MATESNLFKEAIADAKAVRQTALANAKVALEEAFSERYHAMFAEKLKEDAAAMDQEPDVAAGIQGVKSAEETISEQEIDELIKELEAEVGGEPPPPAEPDTDDASFGVAPAVPGAPPAPFGAPGAMPPAMPGAVPPGCPPGCSPVGGAMPGVAPSGDPALAAAAPAPNGAPFGAAPAPNGAPPAMPPSDVPPVGQEDEDVNLDELLKSLKEEIEKEEEEEEEAIDEQTKLATSGIGGKAGGSDNKKPSASAHNSSKIESGGLKQHGFPSPNGTKIGPADATTTSRPNEGSNASKTNLSTPSLGGQSGPALKAARPNSKGDFENTAALEENRNLKKQLAEATETITYVKGQLNEINLLNAKLLYTNKLFKEYNMNNEQKMRIVEMFDLSKNVREVKLTYTNIAESLNFGGSDIKRKVVSATNANAQSITEGLASKPVGSTKPSREIISESKSAMVSKFQKLAGIQKK